MPAKKHVGPLYEWSSAVKVPKDSIDLARFVIQRKTHIGMEDFPLFELRGETVFLPRMIRRPFSDELVRRTTGDRLTKTYNLLQEPREYQSFACTKVVEAIRTKGGTVFKSPPGSGKTFCAIDIVRRLGYKTMILVPTEQLLLQWVKAFKEKAGIDVGVYYGKRKDVQDITIGLVPSFLRKTDPKEFDQFGLLIGDEVHQLGAEKWAKVAFLFNAHFRLGLSATPERADGLHKVIYAHFGAVDVEIKSSYLEQLGFILKPKVIVLHNPKDNTGYKRWNGEYSYPDTCNLIAYDNERNEMLAQQIIKNDLRGRRTLTITTRLEQIDALTRITKNRANIDMGQLRSGSNYAEVLSKNHLVGIQSLVKQGLDKPELETVFLGTPVSDEAMLIQVVGRLNRVSVNKQQPVIVDILDSYHSPLIFAMPKFERNQSIKNANITPTPLERAFMKRMDIYRKLGMSISTLHQGKFFAC